MTIIAKSALVIAAVATSACGQPPAKPEAPPTVAVEPSAAERRTAGEPTEPPPTGSGCRCDILDFDSDGPPKSTCELTFADDGTGTLRSLTAEPAFSATWRPDEHYGYQGTFDLECDAPWCGRQELTVHDLGEGEYRITVARSDEGPPSHVLWLSCAAAASERPREAGGSR